MKKLLYILWIVGMTSIMASCYREKTAETEHHAYAGEDSAMVADSISFATKHHYSVGYNFIVHNDSIELIAQLPEEHVSQLETDTLAMMHNQQLAVMDIHIVPQDSVDSVWVKLISEEGETGWIHESELLPNVVPTDPISQFIMSSSL